MSKKISISELGKDLDNILVEYKKNIDELVETGTDENIKAARTQLRAKSPAATKPVSIGVDKVQTPGTYRNGWYVTTKKNSNLYTKVIANRIYQLTHLLEFGHHSRNGGWVKPKPHIRQTEKEFQVKFVEGLEENIKRGI